MDDFGVPDDFKKLPVGDESKSIWGGEMGLAHVSIDKNDRKMMELYITSDHWVQLGWFLYLQAACVAACNAAQRCRIGITNVSRLSPKPKRWNIETSHPKVAERQNQFRSFTCTTLVTARFFRGPTESYWHELFKTFDAVRFGPTFNPG